MQRRMQIIIKKILQTENMALTETPTNASVSALRAIVPQRGGSEDRGLLCPLLSGIIRRIRPRHFGNLSVRPVARKLKLNFN